MQTQVQPPSSPWVGLFRDARDARAGGLRAGATRRGAVVLDHAIPDPGAFLAAVPPGFDVLWLGPSAEPLAALLCLLGDGPSYASLHVVSHGRPGALLLGGCTVDGRRLRERRAEVRAIGRRLGPAAEVVLYGCEVGAGADGRAFVESLADLLDADVTASATPTGAAERGGDWRLDVVAGRPAGGPLFGAREMAGYRGLLAAPSITSSTGWVDVIKGAIFDPANDPQAGTAGLDLRGDATHALLQAQSYTDGATATDYTGFRILYAGSTPGPYYFIGFDVDGNGALDAFLGVEPSGNGAGVYVYDADPSKTNTSPSTTGIIDSNANPRIQLAGATFGPVTVDASTSHFVIWVKTSDLINGINAKTGAAVTASSALNYLVFSATQDNSINGDLGGASVNSNQSFTSLGVFTRQSLSAPSPGMAPVPAPANLALTLDTGASASDRITSDGRVSGTAQAGATVTLYEGATVLGTATANGSGAWTITPGGLQDGPHTVTATASDGNGTSAASAGLTYTLDRSAPAVAITGPGGPVNQAAQTVTGTAEPGGTVELFDGTVSLGTAAAGAGGTWTINAVLTGQGAHGLTATATDAAGNAGHSAAVTYTLDTLAPGAPPSLTATDDAGPITGALSNGARTDDADLAVRVSLAGTGAQAGDTVRLYDGTGTASPLGGSYTLTAQDLAAGHATLQTGPLADGTTYAITARITDAVGNQGAASAATSVTEDATAPPAPVITGPGGPVNQAAQTITGTAEPGSTVELFDGATSLGTATAGGGGAWSLGVVLAGQGAHGLTAKATDAAGNIGPASAPVTYTLTAPPGAPPSLTVTDDVGAVTGALPGGARTDDTDLAVRVSLVGTGAQAGDTAQLYDGTGTAQPLGAARVLTAADIADGAATLQTGTLTDGATYAITARITGAAGGQGGASGPVSVSVDATAPLAPAITGFAPDTGVGGDGITAGDGTGGVTLSGTAEAGSTVTVSASKDGGAPFVVGTVAAGGGGWSLSTGALAEGGYAFTASATDAAGNTGPASAPLAVAVDRTAPAAPSIASVTDDAGSVIGALADGARTDDADLAVRVGLAGTGARAGDTVRLYDGAGTAALLGGSYTLTSQDIAAGYATLQTGALADGATYAITARITDAAGNAGPASASFTAIEDRTAPTVAITGPGGPINRAAQTLTGTAGAAEAGRTVTLRDGAAVIGTATVLGDGTWSANVALVGDGPHGLTAGLTDAAGNAATSTAVVYTLDTVAPGAPAITGPGGLTNQAAQTLTGTAEPGSAVTVFDGAVPLGTATANGGGAWSMGVVFAGQGAHGLTATAADAAGNTGPASAPVGYTLDSVAPVPVAATFLGGTITLVLSDASPLDAANPPPAGAFSVARTVGATTSTLQPTGVSVDAGGRRVTLTFAQSLAGASLVLLDYTDPGQGAPGALWDAPHNRAASFARFAVTPEDNDGVAPAVEENVPGLPDAQGAITPGDGNADGVPDAVQPDVTSFGFVPGGGAGPAAYATLVAGSVAPGGGGAQLSAVSQGAAVPDAPAGLVAPYGEFSFSSTVGAVGGTQSFRLILPDDPAVTGYWKVSRLDGRWYDIATTVDRSVPGFVALGFSIQDGGAFDDDGAADGSISDPGVPGSMAAIGGPPAPAVSGLVTNRADPVVSGTWGGTNGGTDGLSVTVAGTTYTLGVSPALRVDGTAWTLQLPALADGAYAVTAAATRAGGGSAQAVLNDALLIDTVAPAVTIGLTRDSNAFRTEGILRAEALTGTATPGATLEVGEGGATGGAVRANAAGTWLFRPAGSGAAGATGSNDGAHTVAVREVDAAGNAGSASFTYTPVVSPDPVAGVADAEWRSMDLADLLNGGGELRFVAGTERVLLADGSLSVGRDTTEAFLTRLYHGLLGRASDAGGISWWQHLYDHGASKTDLAEAFLRMDEAGARVADRTDTGFVQALYEGVLGREGADGEIALWAEQLAAGRTRGAVLADIADSPEAKQHWAGVASDGVWVRDVDAALVRAAYLAAFGREADAGGLRYWAGMLKHGATPGQVGEGIAATAEFQAVHARQDDAGFVEGLYANGLGRAGEAPGVAGWVDALRTGAMTRGEVLVGVAGSAEAQGHLYWAL